MDFTAVETGIYTYCNDKNPLPVRVIFHNVTAITYVNNMGSIKSGTGNNIDYRIWNFCTENKLWVSPTHIPGRGRTLLDATEWKLHPELFQKIVDKSGKPGINLFVSKIDKLVKVCAFTCRTKNYDLSYLV